MCTAWNYFTGRGIKIGIMDTGIEATHTDLAANMYGPGFDTESGTSSAKVFREHGTHCAGIAAAVRNNGIQVAGVAPDAYLVSISNPLEGGTNSRLKRADGFICAIQNGIDIISNSWNSNSYHDAIDEAIAEVFSKGREGRGCIVVFSAGNTNSNVRYPANCNPKILAVGSIDNNGQRSEEGQMALGITNMATV